MIVSYNNLKAVTEALQSEAHLYVDTETYGLMHEDKPFSVAICGEGKAYYFNFKAYDGLHSNFVLNPSDLAFILQKATRIHAHNAKFDMQMLRKVGIYPGPGAIIHCTAAQERVHYNAYGHWSEYSLDACGKRIGVPKDKTVEEYIKKHGLYDGKKPLYDKVPLDLISKYALNDVLLCRELSKHQTYSDDRLDVWLNEALFTEVAADMQWHGVKVDTDYTKKAAQWHSEQALQWRQEYLKSTNQSFVDSNKELKGAFTVLGEDFPLTDKGNPSFRAAALNKMTSPLANIVKRIRYHEKMNSTYFSNILNQLDSNGVIHPDIIQHGTETGRISCRDPNMNNLPHAQDFDLFPVRKCFVPREGHIFVFIDYKQQEYRLMLDLAGEHQMIAQINAGLDVHTATAELVGITRDAAKTLNFALLYGMGVEALAEALKCTPQEAAEMKDKYFSKLPKVQQFISHTKITAKQKGFATNHMGRRCHIAKTEYAYKIPNHVIQGGCADIMKKAMNRIAGLTQEHFPATKMVGQVYDELILEMTPEELSKLDLITRIMTKVYTPKNGLGMDVSVEFSKYNWHDTVKTVKELENG